MKNYIATVRVKGISARTTIAADSAIHAKLLLQYQYGLSGVVTNPVLAEASQSPTPEQQRIDTLSAAKEKASANLAAERKRQQVNKAQKALAAANQIKAVTANSKSPATSVV